MKKTFSITDILSTRAVKSNENSNYFEEVFLSPFEVIASEENFYSQENIEELADSFLLVGQQQPSVLARVNGKYRIVSGHRRNAANIYNVERGVVPEETKVRYLCREMSDAMFSLSLIVGNAFTRKLTPYEEMRQASELKAALIRARDEDGIELNGRIRDYVAEMMEVSPTQVARYNKIESNISHDASEHFRVGNIGISTAYELSSMSEEQQDQIVKDFECQEKFQEKSIAEILKNSKQEAIATKKNVSEMDTTKKLKTNCKLGDALHQAGIGDVLGAVVGNISEVIAIANRNKNIDIDNVVNNVINNIENEKWTNETFLKTLSGTALEVFLYAHGKEITSRNRTAHFLKKECDVIRWRENFERWGY